MKRFAAIVLVLTLLLSLFACSKPNTDTTTNPGTTTNPSTQPGGTTAPSDGTTTAPTDVPTDPTVGTTPPTSAPTDPTDGTTPPTEPGSTDTIEVITIAKALELCGEPGNITTERYYIRGIIDSISNPNYGQMTISDGTGTINVYGTYSADGAISYGQMTEKPYKGDEVLLHCILQNYNGTKEVKNARLIEFKRNEQKIDESAYTAITVAGARKAAKGTKVKVEGVVAKITYANGMIPAGLILVDGTSSIYVYDGDLAGRVKEGNKITILAEKDYWILGDEQNNAAKFGYKGCNQLTSVVLVSNDNGKHDFDKKWIETASVKDIIDTPVSTDISTKIYKVTAQIVKAPGNGFTNYYINDLDGKTGTYTYTQCNGSDFAWLDAFDGKICTVYLVALNAKSTNSDCFWRFLPVAVVDEGFNPNTVNGAEHAVKYYGIPQFQTSYSGDPALQLITSVDADLLGFKGIKLSYASSDTSVISVDGGVMHCLKTGSAKITITGSYNGKTYSATITISVTITQSSTTYPTVSDAIAAQVGEKVTVKGIVGPSLVNKTGFYLIDETGVIAVETTAAVLETLKIGYEVVLEADRGFNNKADSKYSQYGQTCLKNATVVVNNYGEHPYPTTAFKGDISVADFYNLDITKDYTTSVFTMKATVLVVDSGYSSNIYLTDGSTQVRLYCSSASQYGWLKQYAGQEVTVEIAACNWNSKNYYVGCVLAVINADGTKTLNELNFQH